MTVQELLREKREEILRLATRHGAQNIRIFGSAARGEAGPNSDIDFLVEMEENRSLLDHIALMQDLEDVLGRKVDIVTTRALNRHIRDQVLAEAIPL